MKGLEGITTRYRFGRVVETKLPRFIPREAAQGLARRPPGDREIHAGGILMVWLGCYQ
jgi:hypothetical protein